MSDERAPATAVAATGGQVVRAQAVSAGGCEEEFGGDAIGLCATYSFDSDAHHVGPYSVAVRFIGHRVGAEGIRDPRDRFEQTEQVDDLLPGGGQVTITTKVVGVNPGHWKITAVPVRDVAAGAGGGKPARRDRPGLPTRQLSTRTKLAPLLHGPGVRQFAWPVLVLLGVFVALAMQALLLARVGGDGSGGWSCR